MVGPRAEDRLEPGAFLAPARRARRSVTAPARRPGGQRGGDQQGADTRFTSQFTVDELPELVRQITLHARPDDPAATTQAQFDDARGPAGYPNAPRARS